MNKLAVFRYRLIVRLLNWIAGKFKLCLVFPEGLRAADKLLNDLGNYTDRSGHLMSRAYHAGRRIRTNTQFIRAALQAAKEVV